MHSESGQYVGTLRYVTVEAGEKMLKALQSWEKFWDDMPKGQLGKIVCDVGLLNDAFMQTRDGINEATKS